MYEETMSRLGARLFGERVADVHDALKAVDSLVVFSEGYRELLALYGGAILFDNGAKYFPRRKCPLFRSDGSGSLELLFGLGRGEYSILRKIEQYEGELPSGYVPIGDAPGGNLFCLDSEDRVFLWDHESDVDSPAWPISDTLHEFIEMLRPDESEDNDSNAIIKSESFLDF